MLSEWTICVVARESSSVFEWGMHLPLAVAPGVPPHALAALDARQSSPRVSRSDLALTRNVVCELVGHHRLGDETYAEAPEDFGEPALVELLTLVCWLMNVARTPAPAPSAPPAPEAKVLSPEVKEPAAAASVNGPPRVG